MNYISLLIVPFAVLLLLTTGCDSDHDHGSAPSAPSQEHGHSHGHDHAGTKETLGRNDVGGYEIVAVQNGKSAPGADVNFDVEILGEPKPTAVRFWLGVSDAPANAKKAADEVKDAIHHVDLQVPSGGGVQVELWVEIERSNQEPVRTSFPLK